ncbi:ARM repeat-containing protein [Dacryopinax primogenitus]|uniref:ARM repeat-containing protein n=1 Tax=Dacryopinax primogenitus (strain DJM 731) TaxID=1858805 RepID=M5G2X0_DACPD|nr:ARM repeat-containing protein [Dacryopinax primogenitus]EJU02575.1 ARM repeat-containing protein [Dacryopinax primogenitus]
MGKSQKKRTGRRHNPVRVPDDHLGHGLAAAKDSVPADRAAQVLPVMQKLSAPDAGDRTWACAAISNLISNDPGTRRLLQGKNVVGQLITRLSDSAEEVVVEASGALRNLCIDGGVELGREMYNKNVLSPLKACVQKMSTTLDRIISDIPAEPAEIPARKLVYPFAENVLTLFWCLSETSQKALTAINALDLPPFLMAFVLNRERIPLSTVIAAAQCLYVLTDDNDPFVESVRSSGEWVGALMDCARQAEIQPNGMNGVNGVNGFPKKDKAKPREDPERQTELRVLACGILRNIIPLPSLLPAAAIDIDAQIVLPTIIPLLSLPLSVTAARAVELQGKTTAKPLPKKNQPPGNDHLTEEEQELEGIERRLRTLLMALEVLAGVCAVLPDEVPLATETEEAGMDEDMDEDLPPEGGGENEGDEHEEEETPVEHPEASEPALPLPSVLQTLLALPSQLLPLIPPPPVSYLSPSPVPPITSALAQIHLRALEALSNLFLGAAAFGAPVPRETREEVWRVVWDVVSFAQQGTQHDADSTMNSTIPEEMREAAVGVLWACLESAGSDATADLGVPDDTAHKLMQICASSVDEATRARCVGSLARLGQRADPRHKEENKMIAVFLFHPFTPPCKSQSAQMTLAHMHGVIDMFSDETSANDVVFDELGCLGRMEQARHWLNREVRRWKGRERDEGRVMVTEWTRFVTWRKSLPEVGEQEDALME